MHLYFLSDLFNKFNKYIEFNLIILIVIFVFMRISKEEKEIIISTISSIITGALKIYLYGSRTRKNTKGGDIDILILTENPLPYETIRKIKINIFDLLPDVKIDIVSSTFTQKSPFVKLIENDAVLLWERI